MLNNKLFIACFMVFNTAVAVASTVAPATSMSAPLAVAPASTASISSCTHANGMLGDTNTTLRDFCLTQTSDVGAGLAHFALPFALGYYATLGCTAQSAASAGNCQNAANTIANGIVLAFHLNYKTLLKIRNAESQNASSSCPCSS